MAALVGYVKRTVLRWRLKVSAVRESLVSIANHSRLWVQVAEGSFAKFKFTNFVNKC